MQEVPESETEHLNSVCIFKCAWMHRPTKKKVHGANTENRKHFPKFNKALVKKSAREWASRQLPHALPSNPRRQQCG